jgi:hypothetical protein
MSTRKHNNRDSLRIVPLSRQETLFSDDTLQSLRELGTVLGKIRERLLGEGYVIKHGKLYKPAASRRDVCKASPDRNKKS